MESLPESSPESSTDFGDRGDLVKSDRGLPSADQVDQPVDQQVEPQLDRALPEEINHRDRFTWSNLGIILSVPFVGGLVGLGLIYLVNPLSISWLASSNAPAFYSGSLWNIPKSIKQIQSELGRSQLKLGENYQVKKDAIVYTVLETETQNIREIRIYQTISDRGEEKFLLVSTTTIAGIDEYFVRSPF